uniref:ATP synthase F0 subunit 8 n=1 Tax=Ophiophthalmus serratus TaxID=2993811 RepID=A0A9E8ICY7_9ECHI|nr:ATP synthase F0 subunit 8 [Ophiophthalmus serratus]UZG65882.1 ATP synthase F0 subunit 8 [Ophiophthalmus serratus]
MPQLELSVWLYNLCINWNLLLVVYIIINFNNTLTYFHENPLIININNNNWTWT